MVGRLSVIMITKNEEATLAGACESVQFADELIILDSGSTDKTVEIARQYTDRVIETDWPGDGPQKNRGIEQASGDWILCLDADERVSPALAQTIQSICQSERAPYAAYDIRFQSYYLGHPIRFGDWMGESHIRLFKRGLARFTPAFIYGAQGAHCDLTVDGKIGKIHEKITHHPFPNFEKLLRKMNEYSTGSAAIRAHHGKRGGLGPAITHGLWAFLRGYIFKFGFLDGAAGFMLAVSNAEGTYYRYLKVGHLQRASS